ncbi:hypothetical protein [Roseococcus pinisoli]|uniref:Glycosyltransferase RgtA/B/C/D-like domain-containing protein n=1 Tax=Roseococcus pinisoli TaxID=2835040 RepID=A0ABS5QEW0_9PROT|nr:hypothetical protein [Roseococcus pinisoli]MBS7811841.1 hypothetical protein [Roseococcus pinisoli]
MNQSTLPGLPSIDPEPQRRTALGLPPLVPILVGLVVLAFLVMVISPPMNHDVAAVLDFAMRWRNGEVLYRDLIDMNPPLIFMLTRGAVVLGEAFGIGPIQSVLWSVLMLCAIGATLALRLWRDLPKGPIEAAAVAVGLPLLLITVAYDFGQREHLMLAASLPYLMLATRRAEGVATSRPLALGVAVLAACFFALKPHFLGIPALVELYVLWRVGRPGFRDPVPWVMAVVWIAYLAMIQLAFPAYTQFALPLAVEFYHSSGGLTWVLANERMAPSILVMLPAAAIALRRPRGLAPVLALAGLAALAAALIQMRGWTYHAMPFKLLGSLLAAQLTGRWLDANLRTPARAAPGFAALTAGFFTLQALLNGETWRAVSFEGSWPGVIAAEIGRDAPGGRVLVLAPGIHPIFPAINYAHALSTLPTLNNWLVQAANETCLPNGARYREPSEMGVGERLIWDAVTQGMAHRPPEALMVARDTSIPFCGRDFDYLEYYGRDPGFAAALQRYRLKADFAGYRIFQREDP